MASGWMGKEEMGGSSGDSPQGASPPRNKPTIRFPEMSRVEARAHHALMEGLFWHRVPGNQAGARRDRGHHI